MAFTNGDGAHVDIEMAAPFTIGASHSYPYQEAVFYGNIFSATPKAYYCVGKDFAKAEGLTKLGVENVGAIATRGVLIDVAALKGVAQLEGGYEISVADINAALAREKVEIHAGDVVIFHTGWGSLWGKDNAKFNSGAPGPGLAAAQYLIDKKVVMVGADTWSMEVIPNPNKDLQFPVHQQLIPRNGIYIFENLLTEDLARDRAYEFAFFFAPLRLKGATGSPGNPLAIR